MNMQIKIESGIPIPEDGRGKNFKYPFAQMKVGDSFAVPDDRGPTKTGKSFVQNRLSVASRTFALKHDEDAKFRTRSRTENGQPVIRIWRIK